MYVCMYVYINMYICMHVCMCMCMGGAGCRGGMNIQVNVAAEIPGTVGWLCGVVVLSQGGPERDYPTAFLPLGDLFCSEKAGLRRGGA